MSHYDESIDIVRQTIETLRRDIPGHATLNVIIYSKGPSTENGALLPSLVDDRLVNSIVTLPNLGREGETYLQHIVRNYNSSLAPQTLFMQPHIAWEWVAIPRIQNIQPRIGFMSFGPYLNASCSGDGNEIDTNGMRFGRIPQIFSSFTGELCPPTGFAVSVDECFVFVLGKHHAFLLKHINIILTPSSSTPFLSIPVDHLRRPIPRLIQANPSNSISSVPKPPRILPCTNRRF